MYMPWIYTTSWDAEYMYLNKFNDVQQHINDTEWRVGVPLNRRHVIKVYRKHIIVYAKCQGIRSTADQVMPCRPPAPIY